MAIGLLITTSKMNMHASPNSGFIGELSLNACIRPVSGILPIIIKAKEPMSIGSLWLLKMWKKMVKGIEILGCNMLRDAVNLLEGKPVTPSTNIPFSHKKAENSSVDFSEVKGHKRLIEYISIAAAGGHNFLLIGTPGCRKTMIAKRIPTILSAMIEEEVLRSVEFISLLIDLKILVSF